VTEPVIDILALVEAEPVDLRLVEPLFETLGELETLVVVVEEKEGRYVSEGFTEIESEVVARFNAE